MLKSSGTHSRQTAHLEVMYLAWMVRPIPTSSGGFEGEYLAITPLPRRDSTRVKRGERALDSEPGHSAVNGSGDATPGRNMRAMSMAISSDCS
jgi:hypothetical protein